jgi:hypothetical protein
VQVAAPGDVEGRREQAALADARLAFDGDDRQVPSGCPGMASRNTSSCASRPWNAGIARRTGTYPTLPIYTARCRALVGCCAQSFQRTDQVEPAGERNGLAGANPTDLARRGCEPST